MSKKKLSAKEKRKYQWWKRRIETGLDLLLKDFSRKAKDHLIIGQKYREMKGKIDVESKCLNVIMDLLKQWIVAAKAKVVRYDKIMGGIGLVPAKLIIQS